MTTSGDTKIPKPGDRIRIIKGACLGQIHTVVECPDPPFTAKTTGAWIQRKGAKPSWFNLNECEVITESTKCVNPDVNDVCRYCKDTGKVTLLNWSIDCEECNQGGRY